MSYKGPPKVLELVTEELADRITNLIISIGMGEMQSLPILISSHITNSLINSTIGVDISYLSSSDRLGIAQGIIQELGYSMKRTTYSVWTIIQERRLVKNNVPKERTIRFDLGLGDIQYMSFKNGQIYQHFGDRCRLLLSVNLDDFSYLSSSDRLEVTEMILGEL